MSGPRCCALPASAWLAVMWLLHCWGGGTCQDVEVVDIAYQDCVALTSWPHASRLLGLTRCTKPMTKCTKCGAIGVDDRGQVTHVELISSGLSGPLPSQWSQLRNLEAMSLANNSLSGALPSQWSRLSELQHMSLDLNDLSGPLPSQWSQLSNLKTMGLSYNSLSGPLPAQWSQLSKLQRMWLGVNNLSGPLPFEWSQLSNLETMFLMSNGLSGTLPALWSKLKKLTTMLLFNNNFSGPLPADWSELSSLSSMMLHSNALNGTLPSQWSELKQLNTMWLGNNMLSGTLPYQWSTLTTLVWFGLYNNKLSGSIPSTWRMPSLSLVQLDNNTLSGTIPQTWLASSTRLQWFSASNNNFNGSLAPLGLDNKPELVILDVQSNLFSGQVPAIRLPNLQILRVGYNNFTSTLPRLPAMLILLDASHNAFDGSIPSLPQSLVYLNLDNNMFTTMPSLNASNLTFASLANNRLSRHLPGSVGGALQLLNISNNQLTNTLPQSWANHTWVVLDISRNSFSGPLPEVLPARMLVASRNNFSGTLPEHWPQNNPIASVVDLKGNRFQGALATSWFASSRIEQPSNLQYLDVSNNSFTGGVPFEWIATTDIKLVLGKDLWMQHGSSEDLLLGKETKWFKAVCTNPKLYRSILDVSRVRDVDAQVGSFIASVQDTLLNVTRGVVGNIPVVQDSDWDINEALSILYFAWSDLSAPSPYLKQLKASKIEPDIQPNDLCKGPGALPIVLALWAVLLACILACVVLYVWLRPYAMHLLDTRILNIVVRWLLAQHGQPPGWIGTIVHVAGIIVNLGLYWADIVTALLVISNVMGNNWLFYTLVAIFLSNYAYSAGVLTRQLLHTNDQAAWHRLHFFPTVFFSLPFLDSLAFLHIAGLPVHRLARGIAMGVNVNMDKYHEGRVLMETLLQSIPSCIVQSISYTIGNKPGSAIFVDLRLFLFSVAFSSARTIVTCMSLMWEGLFHQEGIFQRSRDVLMGVGVLERAVEPLTKVAVPQVSAWPDVQTSVGGDDGGGKMI